jgi:hypothetical protein
VDLLILSISQWLLAEVIMYWKNQELLRYYRYVHTNSNGEKVRVFKQEYSFYEQETYLKCSPTGMADNLIKIFFQAIK